LYDASKIYFTVYDIVEFYSLIVHTSFISLGSAFR